MLKFNYKNITLYNKKKLSTELGLSNSMAENIIIKGYETWGESLFTKLNGDFAFSFYDEAKDMLYATRDALGIRALYYAVVDGQYYFSDDIDVLFQETKIKKTPNIKSMKTLLWQTTIEYEDTMYEGIKRIPPGHYLKVTKKQATLVRYWYPENITINYDISLDEASTTFKKLFQKAIEERVGTDSKTAYELSGGLDSSSVVSMVKKYHPQKKVDTYTMSFGGLRCDESSYVEAVEEQYQFSTHKIASESIDYQKRYGFKFNYEVNPHWPITTTFTMLFPMIQHMHKEGKKIIITGQGGDHLLTGSCRVLADLLRRGALKKFIKEIRSGGYTLAEITGCGIWPLVRGKSTRNIKRIIFFLLNKKSQRKQENITDLFRLHQDNHTFKRSDLQSLFSSNHSLTMDGNVLHILEKMYSVEFRHPFFDKNLVEFVIALPPEYRYSQGWIKMLLRYAMEDTLADKIRSRHDKAEFSEVILQQLHAIDVKKLLDNALLASLGIITQKEIDRVFHSYEKENHQDLLFLWSLVNLEYWYTTMTKNVNSK